MHTVITDFGRDTKEITDAEYDRRYECGKDRALVLPFIYSSRLTQGRVSAGWTLNGYMEHETMEATIERHQPRPKRKVYTPPNGRKN